MPFKVRQTVSQEANGSMKSRKTNLGFQLVVSEHRNLPRMHV